jgi:glycerate dehydrogenase
MDMKKIVVLDAATLGDDLSLAPLDAVGEVTVYRMSPPETVRERIAGADAVILNKVKIGEAQLPDVGAPGIICVAATGFDNIDLEACRRRGVAVANVKGYSSESVMQVTVGLVLSLVSHLPTYCAATADGSYTHGGNANMLTPTYHEVAGMTWGVVGAGKIGSRVADVARALGCRVLTNRRHPDGVSVDLETLLRESDIVTVHTPLTPETRGLIGEREIALMKDGVILVNMARGAVTDEAAVAQAIRSGKLGALGCDVYSVEPFSESHPYYDIRDRENVLLTPHMSWGAYEARDRCLREMIQNMQAFFAGEQRNRVDL